MGAWLAAWVAAAVFVLAGAGQVSHTGATNGVDHGAADTVRVSFYTADDCAGSANLTVDLTGTNNTHCTFQRSTVQIFLFTALKRRSLLAGKHAAAAPLRPLVGQAGSPFVAFEPLLRVSRSIGGP